MRGREAFRYVEQMQRRLCLEERGLHVHMPQITSLPDGEVGSASDFDDGQPCARIEIACKRLDDHVRPRRGRRAGGRQ